MPWRAGLSTGSGPSTTTTERGRGPWAPAGPPTGRQDRDGRGEVGHDRPWGAVGGAHGSAVGRRACARSPWSAATRGRGGSPVLPAVRLIADGPGWRGGFSRPWLAAAELVPHLWAPAVRQVGGVPGRGGDDEGRRPLRQRRRPPGVRMVAVDGSDRNRRAVPGPCLPSVWLLTVRVGARLSRYPTHGPQPGGGPPGCEGGRAATRTGRRPYLQRCRVAGVCMGTVMGSDGQSSAVPRRCLPSVWSLAVRVDGPAGTPLTGPTRLPGHRSAR